MYSQPADERKWQNHSLALKELLELEYSPVAVKCLEDILASDSPAIFHHRLSAGQGLICNNTLHTRSAFEDEEGSLGRLVYRARFFERVN